MQLEQNQNEFADKINNKLQNIVNKFELDMQNLEIKNKYN